MAATTFRIIILSSGCTLSITTMSPSRIFRRYIRLRLRLKNAIRERQRCACTSHARNVVPCPRPRQQRAEPWSRDMEQQKRNIFVGLIPMESSACTGCVCQYNRRDKDHDFSSQLASEDRRCNSEVVRAVEPCKMLPGDAIDVEARVEVPRP